MRYAIIFLLLTTTAYAVNAQKSNPNYDESLAKELKSDDYGMRYFVFVMLKTGENTGEGEERSQAFNGHMQNIGKLVEAKKLIVAGPMDKNDLEYRGIFIFDSDSPEEVEELLQTDPAIRQGYLEPIIFKWYGSAALPTYLEAADKVWKSGFRVES